MTVDVQAVSADKLPKSMKYWFRLHGVKFNPESGCGVGARRALKIGCARPYRVFRALPHLGLLQICDGYHDRWANSVGAEVPMPRTHAEFETAMKHLLANATLCEVDPAEELEKLQSWLIPAEENVASFRQELAELRAYWPHCNGAKWVSNSIRYVERSLARCSGECARLRKAIKFQKMRLAETS